MVTFYHEIRFIDQCSKKYLYFIFTLPFIALNQTEKWSFLLEHLYRRLSGSEEHSREDYSLGEAHLVCRGDDVHVEVGDAVYRPVEPGQDLLCLSAHVTEDAQTDLLHLLH